MTHTSDGQYLIVSDGSDTLYWINPDDFSIVKNVKVTEGTKNKPVYKVNELELINGKLYANVFLSNDILVIDPKTGHVEKRINFISLLNDEKAYILANEIVWN